MPLISRRDLSPEELLCGRPRPPRRRRWLLIVILALPLVLALGIYAILAYDYYSHPVNIAHDYAAELNAPILAVPEQQRAWPHYRRALLVLEPLPQERDHEWLEPGTLFWESGFGYLRRNARALDRVRAATAVTPLGVLVQDSADRAELAWRIHHRHVTPEEAASEHDPSANPRLIAVTCYAEISGLRLLSDLLAGDARLATSEHDARRAVANILALLRMANQLKGQPLLFHQSEGETIERTALDLAKKVIANHPDVFNDTELSDLAAYLESQAAQGPLRLDLQYVKLLFRDDVQALFTDDGLGDGLMTSAVYAEEYRTSFDDSPLHRYHWLPAPVAARFVATRSEAVAELERRLEAFDRYAELPLWEREEMRDRISAHLADEDGKHWFVRRYVSWLPEVADEVEMLTQERDATLVAIALARYNIRYDKWPTSLANLVPEFLLAIPLDRFDGKALRYRLNQRVPELYSVGSNGLDEQGTPSREIYYRWLPDRGEPGDWILWPPPTPTLTDSWSARPEPPEPPIDDVETDESQIEPPTGDTPLDEPTPQP